MPLALWNIQWLNQNAGRRYPMANWATTKDRTEQIAIPDSFIVGLRFPVDSGMEVTPERFFIYSLGIFATGYNVAIGYHPEEGDDIIVAAVNIAKSTHTENTTYAIPGINDFAQSVGQITLGKLDEVEQLPPGVFYFDYEDTALEVDAIDPMIQGIASITVVNGEDRSSPLYGHIELTAGTNFRLRVSQNEGESPQIIFDAIAGEGLNEICECEAEDEGPVIRTINGIAPYPTGDFRMAGDNCLEFTEIDHGLQVIDNCSQPCCGCEELDALTRQIQRFADGVATLQNFLSRVQGEVTNINSIILASKLSDQGCT